MSKPEWGRKRQCSQCLTKFYDFKAEVILCPKCRAPYDPEAALRPRRARFGSKSHASLGDGRVEHMHEDLLEVVDLEGEGGEDVVLEDTSDLGGDDVLEDLEVSETPEVEEE